MKGARIDISVVVPTYNRASLLIKLLDAWREVDQVTTVKYELIFSDDGSTDDTLDTLKQHAKLLPLVILENEHGGASRARNGAIRRAQGERILMLGDDIFPDAQLLNSHVELSRQVGVETAILGDIKWHPELTLNYLMTHITEVGHEQFSLNAFKSGQYVDFRHFYTSNISVDRQFLLSEAVLFDEAFYKYGFEDSELGYRLSKRGLQILFDPSAIAYHHHIYDVAGFCERQQSAGEMVVVFVKAHPELESAFGVQRTWQRYSRFRDCREGGYPGPIAALNFGDVIKTCEAYETQLPQATEPEQKYIKLALSSLYVRLFRSFFELGVLTKLDANRTDYQDYLRSVYFDPGSFWGLYLEASDAFKDLSEADRALREIILLSYADQTTAGMQIALANKEVDLLRRTEAQVEAERNLAAAQNELDRVKGSYAWRVGRTVVQPAKIVRQLTRRLSAGSLPQTAGMKEDIDSDNSSGTTISPETEAHSPVRMGILVAEDGLPSTEERDEFLSELGSEHCFIVPVGPEEFRVLSRETNTTTNYESLPVDYLYRAEDWNQRLSTNRFRNALLCLSHVDLDFVLASPSLALLPQVAISSISNQLIFSKKLGLDFRDKTETKAEGRVMRSFPPDPSIPETTIEKAFPNRTISYVPDPGRYTPDHGYLYFGQGMRRESDATAGELRLSRFIPKFKKRKKLIFVLPMVMSVGGVERNLIEVMRQLKDGYDFVVITMDRHDKSHGSFHHQLKGLTEAVYDLMELGNLHYYLAFLNDLKDVYEPDALWICNGMLWLCDHAEHVRRIFHDVPIIDNQAWDAEFGWSEFYHLPGIQSFDRFIATNSQVYRKFVEDLKMDPARIDSIYPCYDSNVFSGPGPVDEQRAFIKEFDLPEDRPVFLFCGRLHEQKGPFDFLELARRRLQKGDDAFFVMRGVGDLAPEVDKFIEDNRLTNLRRISFVENTVPLLSVASGLIITSHYETITIVLLEALAMGLPVLSTDVGDIRPVLEECQAGVIVPEIGDADALEAAYEKWRTDLAHYSAKARQCSAEVSARFSCETIAQQYAASWEKAMLEFT